MNRADLLALLFPVVVMGLPAAWFYWYVTSERTRLPSDFTAIARFKCPGKLKQVAHQLSDGMRRVLGAQQQAGLPLTCGGGVVALPPGPTRLFIDEHSEAFGKWKFVALLSRSGKHIQVEVRANSDRYFPFLRMPRGPSTNVMTLISMAVIDTPEFVDVEWSVDGETWLPTPFIGEEAPPNSP